jgi:hypothetical protein
LVAEEVVPVCGAAVAVPEVSYISRGSWWVNPPTVLELVEVELEEDLVVEIMDRRPGSTHTKHGVEEVEVPTVMKTTSRPREETEVLEEEQVRPVTRGYMAVTQLKLATRTTEKVLNLLQLMGTEAVTST